MPAVEVLYCGVCGLPAEYCEFGPHFDKCKPWLRENCPDLYPELGGDAGEAKPDGDEKKEEAPKASSSGKKKAKDAKMVTIAVNQRNKRKFVTVVTGLDHFGISNKDAAKVFARKFSCGSSLVKGNPGCPDTIDIQGDFQDDIVDVICDNYPEVKEENIKFLEGKGKGKKK
eukprot:GFYU01004756.1.p1 GENE.GFYU01004756.1~~GFYU01004756.1.p1  ORF type:complete len:171 (-),score=59.44 GFYU01004756.1:91-603(-)